MNKIFIIFLFVVNIFAMDNIKAKKVYEVSGNSQTICINDNRLFVGTNSGTVEIFDLKTDEKIKVIKVNKIKDFMGDLIDAKIYSVDVIENKILIVVQGEHGFREVLLYSNDNLEKILTIEENYLIQKAKFVLKDSFVFGLLSNQIGLYNISKKELIYLEQISYSSFSDFALGEDKKRLVTTDESGVVHIFDINKGIVLKDLPGINLDRVYQLDYKNGVVLTAGQDRKAVVFNDFTNYSLDFDFLLYSCALTPKAKLGAIAYNESNDVLVFSVDTKSYLYNLIGQKGTLNQILFINEDEVFISSESSQINYYNLKER